MEPNKPLNEKHSLVETIEETLEENLEEPVRYFKKHHLLLIALLLIPCALIALKFVRQSHAADAPMAMATKATPPVPPDLVTADDDELQRIKVEAVAPRTVDILEETTGKVAFNEDHQTPVISPYAGRIVELLVSKGDTVKRGQPLLVIESPDLVAAENDLAAARVDQNKMQIGLEAAQKAAERAKNLFDREALALKDLQAAQTDLSRAQAEVERANAAINVIENRLALLGKTPSEISELERQPGKQIDTRVTIRAPLSGTIVERKVGPGQFVKPDMPDPLFLISDLSTLWVMADVYESWLPLIRVGAPVQISVTSLPERVFPARVSFINPTVEEATRTVRVHCQVANTDGLLKPDMFAKIKIGSPQPQSVAAVPQSAVITQGADSFLLVEEAHGRFRRRKVTTGRTLNGFLEIKDGAHTGDRVVTSGVMLLNSIVGKAPETATEKSE